MPCVPFPGFVALRFRVRAGIGRLRLAAVTPARRSGKSGEGQRTCVRPAAAGFLVRHALPKPAAAAAVWLMMAGRHSRLTACSCALHGHGQPVQMQSRFAERMAQFSGTVFQGSLHLGRFRDDMRCHGLCLRSRLSRIRGGIGLGHGDDPNGNLNLPPIFGMQLQGHLLRRAGFGGQTQRLYAVGGLPDELRPFRVCQRNGCRFCCVGGRDGRLGRNG